MTEYLDKPDTRTANLDELVELLRMPTVSAREDPAIMRDAVEWLVKRLETLGATTRLLNETDFPIIYAEIKGDSDRSLLFYNHYDVQPPEPLDAWTSDPFTPTTRDGMLYARGTDDNKGSLMSRIHAVEAVLKERGSLPVTVKFLIEGEEESGSPSLAATVAAHRDLLQADACIWENARRDDNGSPTMTLGNKGMYSFELSVRTASADSHSGKANLYPNAIWHLVGALATLRDGNGRILIKGFMESVTPMSDADAEICRTTPGNGEAQARKLGLSELLPGNDDFAVNKALFFTPSLNIQGISGGYTGPGHKTVNPATAFARLECRLVMGQDPHEAARMIKAHLAENGYGDIEVTGRKFGEPYYTRTDSPFVGLVREAGGQVYGRPVVVLPSSPGSGPRYVFRYQPDMPIVALGVGHANSRAHAPDENIAIEDFFLTTKHVAAIISKFADLQERTSKKD